MLRKQTLRNRDLLTLRKSVSICDSLVPYSVGFDLTFTIGNAQHIK